MASPTNELYAAIYTALNVSAVTNIATGGIWQGRGDETIPESAPFVVYNAQGFNENEHTFSFGTTLEGGLLLIKSYSDENSSPAKSPIDLNDEILEACEALLHNGLSLATHSLEYLRKYSDIPTIIEPAVNNREVIGSGRLYQFKIFKA